MNAATLAAAVVIASSVPVAPMAPQAPRLVVVTAGDEMKFSVTQIPAARGETLKIRLIATGTAPKSAMSHNLVILKSGVSQLSFVETAAQAKATDYIPPARKNQILASTILIGNGESAEVEVRLPARAGTYPFLCTFPGHFAAGARGVITVK